MIKLSLIMILVSSISFADVTCPSVLKNCDEALKDSRALVFEQGKQIVNLKQESALQQQIIADQQKKEDNFFHDPIKVAAATTVGILVLEIVTGIFKR